MALKVFHIVFIVASIAMSILVAAWGVNNYRHSGDVTNLGVGIATLLMGVVLIWYSGWFVRKVRALSL